MGWDKTRNSRVDLRLFYAAKRLPNTWTKCRWDPMNNDYPYFYRFSAMSGDWPLCYSSDALKYAQSGYLVYIVCVQWADLMICKTRNLSLS